MSYHFKVSLWPTVETVVFTHSRCFFANMVYLGAQGRMRFIMTTFEFNFSDCGCYMISFIQSRLSKFDTEVNTSKRIRCLRENGLSGW